jgi:hypothetical protein|tara:strand:+ start:307 stop:519 length:213 start_codon:yes stop_codon:yes gene_type:complete
MLDFFDKIQSLIIRIIKLALTLLCLGVVTQLLINDKILGWDPVGNIQDAGSSFIGILFIIILYQLYNKNS